MSQLKPLDVQSIALQGRHLIEASAGTGKTYNITRLYLRLLLERKLSVEQILVVTFTKAATEEIRARIEQEIRRTLAAWDSVEASSDPFLAYLIANFDGAEVQVLLYDALLNLDQANIFTIHGFCKRVLTEQALESEVGFNLEMEVNTQDIALQAVRDAYRRLSEESDNYLRLTEHWVTPEDFYQTFAKQITSEQPIETLSPEDYTQRCHALWQQLQSEASDIQTLIIDKNKDAATLQRSWDALRHWLTQSPFYFDEDLTRPILNGNLTRAKAASHLKELFTAVKDLQAMQPTQIASHAIALTMIEQCRRQFRRDKLALQKLDFDDLIRLLNQAVTQNSALASLLSQRYPVALVDEFQDTDVQQYQIFDAIYQASDAVGLFMIGDPKQAIYSFRGGDIFTYLTAAASTEQRWQLSKNYRSSAELIAAYNPLFARPALFGEGIDYEAVGCGAKVSHAQFDDPAGLAPLVLADFPFHHDFMDKLRKTVHSKSVQTPMADWCAQEISRLLQEVTLTHHNSTLQPNDIAILVRSGTEAEVIRQALSRYGLAGVYLSDRKNIYHSHEAAYWGWVLAAIQTPTDPYAMATALATPLLGANLSEIAALNDQEQALNKWYLQLSHWKALWQKGHFLQMAYQIMHDYYQPPVQDSERSTTNLLHLIELLQEASQTLHQPADLLVWLNRQIDSSTQQQENELRLESDENLIRIITYHGSKGLEYPVVFLPFFSWHKEPGRFGSKLAEMVPYHDSQRESHVWLGNPATNPQAWEAFTREDYAEQMRLFYVAVTRAVYRCYLCITPSADLNKSPLGMALALTDNTQYLAQIQHFIQTTQAPISLTSVDYAALKPTGHHSAQQDRQQALMARSFTGTIERDWNLSSFSSLTRGLNHSILQPEHDLYLSAESPLSAQEQLHSEQLRFTLKKGALTGDKLHAMLEHLHFNQPNWETLARDHAHHTLFKDQPWEAMQTWLSDILAAPLFDHFSLNQLKQFQTLRETEFYFPIEQVNLKAIADFLHAYRQGQEAPEFEFSQASLSGMMHGFIDLIFEWESRYYLADYKSNHLGVRFSDYKEAGMHAAMLEHHYDLQYLIYSVALHRYLQKQLPNYQFEQHFGGVTYLFLRGMSPHHVGAGVYRRTLSYAQISQFDRLLQGALA